MQLWKALLPIEQEKKPQTLFISILRLTSSISIIHTFYTPFFEGLKVLTQNWEQICGKASPNGAQLVRLHRVGHSRAKYWCCYDSMVVLMSEFVNQFVLHTFTMMKKQLRFSMRRYGNVKTLEVLGNMMNKYKAVCFSACYLSNFLLLLITVFIFRISSISANSKILTWTEIFVVLYSKSYTERIRKYIFSRCKVK